MSILSAKRLVVALVLPLALLSLHRPAWAQLESREAIALQNQIMDLRRQLQSLQDQPARANTPTYLGRGTYPPSTGGGNDIVPQLLSRVDALEEQVRQLRGRLDETQNQVQQQTAEFGKRIDDMAFQSQNPQGGGASGLPPQRPGSGLAPPPMPLGAPPPTAGGPPPPPSGPAPRTPEMTIQEGNAALARRDYAAAESAAREVLTGNRTSPRAYDAQFLLAQALAGQRQYSQAAIAYDDTYNRSRRGAHAPDALLGLANSLTAINEKKAACDTLGKLRAEYPSPRPDIREAAASAGQRAGCR
jgi:TolA-binding protein